QRMNGRVVVITGAARGIGREHALLFASLGAHVVVNDLGGAQDGSGADATPAEELAREIGGVAHGSDVSDGDGANQLIDTATEPYGRVDVLVNNAGILRDSFLVNMTADDWDTVMRVHLRGHFACLRHAAAHWRERTRAGEHVNASVINTASP